MADAAPEDRPLPVADVPDDDQRAQRTKTRRKWFLRLFVLLAVAGAGYGFWYLVAGRNFVSTDNAYVGAEIAQITPLMSAQAIEVKVIDTQTVKRGDVLVRLDDSDARIAVAQAEADLASARRTFQQALATTAALEAAVASKEADIARARAALSSAEADFDKARIDLDRRTGLEGSGAVSGEELTSARKAFAAAQAAIRVAEADIRQAEASRVAADKEFAAQRALVAGSTVDTDPSVMAAKARLRSAMLDLDRAIIRAPIDGVVTRRQVQVGQRVTAGTPVMSIVPLDQLFVDANFTERQLRRVKAGMPATVRADIYGGDVVYHGRVVGLSGATGASLAIIPAQNATGNWIKVVQRLPVRIALDPRELVEHPLRVGLSMEVEIDLREK